LNDGSLLHQSPHRGDGHLHHHVGRGLLAMRSLPVAQYPAIIPPQIIVSTTFTGADAVTVEQSVATPPSSR